MVRDGCVMGHGAQHEPHSSRGGRSRSRAAPRPPVHHPEGRCTRRWPKCDSCAAGRPGHFPAAPSAWAALGSAKSDRGRHLAVARKHKTSGRGSEGRSGPDSRDFKVKKVLWCRQGCAEGRVLRRVCLGSSLSIRRECQTMRRGQTSLLGSYLEGPLDPPPKPARVQASHLQGHPWQKSLGRAWWGCRGLGPEGVSPALPSPRQRSVSSPCSGSLWSRMQLCLPGYPRFPPQSASPHETQACRLI